MCRTSTRTSTCSTQHAQRTTNQCYTHASTYTVCTAAHRARHRPRAKGAEGWLSSQQAGEEQSGDQSQRAFHKSSQRLGVAGGPVGDGGLLALRRPRGARPPGNITIRPGALRRRVEVRRHRVNASHVHPVRVEGLQVDVLLRPLELPQRARLDLSDAVLWNLEDGADLVEGAPVAPLEPVTQAEHL